MTLPANGFVCSGMAGFGEDCLGHQFTREGILEFPAGLKEPWGVTTSSNGNIFVVDNELCQVSVFNANKTYLRTFGRKGHSPGELYHPAGVASNDEGLVFVADNLNHCVKVFNEGNGTFVMNIGQGQLSNPWDVAPCGGNIYVADAMKDRIAVFSQDGELTGSFGSEGHGPGQFTYPAGVALSPDGYLYVTSSNDQKLQVFTTNGRHVKSIGSEVLKYPSGVAVTERGQIFVADCTGNSVAVFDKDGRHMYSILASDAQGVTVSPMGYLLVTERRARQVAVFS